MKTLFFLSTLLLLLIFQSCGNDEEENQAPDFTGSWVMTSIRDDCPDQSKNKKVDAEQNGYCQNAGNGGQECIMLHLEINANGTIALESQITLIVGSVVTPQPATTSSGSYSTSENTVIASFTNGDVIAFKGNNNNTTLDWTITKTPTGCDRKWEFERE